MSLASSLRHTVSSRTPKMGLLSPACPPGATKCLHRQKPGFWTTQEHNFVGLCAKCPWMCGSRLGGRVPVTPRLSGDGASGPSQSGAREQGRQRNKFTPFPALEKTNFHLLCKTTPKLNLRLFGAGEVCMGNLRTQIQFIIIYEPTRGGHYSDYSLIIPHKCRNRQNPTESIKW